MVDLNPQELYAKQLSPIDVSNALNLQNLILPAGRITRRIWPELRAKPRHAHLHVPPHPSFRTVFHQRPQLRNQQRDADDIR